VTPHRRITGLTLPSWANADPDNPRMQIEVMSRCFIGFRSLALSWKINETAIA